MRFALLGLIALVSGCTMGYWPKVEGTVDQSKYQADVRECQTATQSRRAALWLPEANWDRAKIDDCMTMRGYRVIAGN